MSWNNILDLSVLEKVNFRELEVLDLVNNKISNVNAIENANFKRLNYLDISYNSINLVENSPILNILKSKINELILD